MGTMKSTNTKTEKQIEMFKTERLISGSVLYPVGRYFCVKKGYT